VPRGTRRYIPGLAAMALLAGGEGEQAVQDEERLLKAAMYAM
jgi:hypothetical protein